MSHTEDASDATFREQGREYEPMTFRERWWTVIELWVLAPLRIIWTDRRTRLGSLILLFFFVLGVIGQYDLLDPPVQNEGPLVTPAFQSWEFPLGTDGTGQDVLALTVHATPAMLKMAFAGGIFATVLGTIVGTLAGYKGGRTEQVLLTISDIVMTIPGLPLLIVLAVALEPRHPVVVGILLGINAWAGLARSLHAQVLTLRDGAYVEASRILGIGSPEIIRDDILPNLLPYIMINFMGTSINIINASVGLYFLGVLPFTSLNWGVMINLAFHGGALVSWRGAHWILAPIFALSLLGFGITIFSQGMDRLFNPRVRARHASMADDTIDEARV